MEWYYVEANQRRGPVTEEQFANLVREGTIRADTLVWHADMANWLPYGEAAAPAAGNAGPVPAAAAAEPHHPHHLSLARPAGQPRTRACTECGRVVPADELIAYHSAWVCSACKDAFFQKMREGVAPVHANEYHYAGFWIRFAAKIVDQIILSVVNFVLFMAIGIVVGVMAGASHQGRGQLDAASIIMVVAVYAFSIFFPAIYSGYFLSRHGATPGKMACGVRVIRSEGDPLTFWRGFGRTFAEMLSGLILAIGYIMAAFDGQKRALHDHICDTRVVYK